MAWMAEVSPQPFLLFFYLILLVNTYFSLKCFSPLMTHRSVLLGIVNAVLAFFYVILPASLDNPTHFIALTGALFTVATTRYLLMLPRTPHRALFERKIFIDNLGTLSSCFALVGVLWGYETYAVALWTAAFVLVNIHVLFIKPLYRCPEG